MLKFLRPLYFLVMLSTVLPGRAWAEPCDADVEEHCSDVEPGMGTVADCIDRKKDKFSYECREHLKKIDTYARKIHAACSFDARQYCRDLKPGQGRIMKCLRSNLDKLSNDCRDAVK